MNPTLKTDRFGNIIENKTGQSYSFTPTGDIDYSGKQTPKPNPTGTPVVGSVQYDIANNLPLGTSASSNYKQTTTIGDVYGTGDTTYDAIGAGYKASATAPDVTPEQLLESKRKLYQAEIDAVNKIYSDKIQSARIAGKNRLGSSTAIQARSGLLGSDFGSAQTANVETQNREIEDAYLNEQNLQIQGILGKARQDAIDEAKAKTEAKALGAKNYIEFLAGAETRKKSRITDLAKSLITQGKDIKTLTDAELATLATNYGTNKETLLATYNEAKLANDKLQADITKAGYISPSEKYGAGSIGEYNFYAEQEKAQGKTPMTYNQYQTQDANRKAVIARAGVSGLTAGQTNSTINSIASAFDNEAIVKNFNVIAEGKKFADSLPNDTTNPADDQALVYSLAKTLDPGSVVREGEYATVQRYAQSLAQSYGKSITQAINGSGFLSEDARKNIKSTINSRYEASKTNYNNVSKEYQRQIDDAKAGKTRTITNYTGGYEAPAGQSGQTSSGIKYTVTQN